MNLLPRALVLAVVGVAACAVNPGSERDVSQMDPKDREAVETSKAKLLAEPEPSGCSGINGCACGETLYGTGYYAEAIPQNMFFVHGMHGDSSVWNNWYNRQKAANGTAYRTINPSLGYTSTYGAGSAARDDWAREIANKIVSENGGANGTLLANLTLVTKSNGTIVALRMLEMGKIDYDAGINSNAAIAAKLVKKMVSIQGAFGGCGASLGDGVKHPGWSGGCGASDTQKGLANDWPSSRMDKSKFTWANSAYEKRITFVRATGGSWPTACYGSEGWLGSGWLCSGSNHDGHVKSWDQDPPSSWPTSTRAEELITVTGVQEHYCHSPGDRYQNAMESSNLFGLYVGRKVTYPLCTSSGCTSGTYTCGGGGGGGYMLE